MLQRLVYGLQTSGLCYTATFSVCPGTSGVGLSECMMSLVCSGLEEVLGVKLPQDLSTDEARDTLAKLVIPPPPLTLTAFPFQPCPCHPIYAGVQTYLITALHCTASPHTLHYTALVTSCTALHCTALHCTALHCTALHCTA